MKRDFLKIRKILKFDVKFIFSIIHNNIIKLVRKFNCEKICFRNFTKFQRNCGGR